MYHRVLPCIGLIYRILALFTGYLALFTVYWPYYRLFGLITVYWPYCHCTRYRYTTPVLHTRYHYPITRVPTTRHSAPATWVHRVHHPSQRPRCVHQASSGLNPLDVSAVLIHGFWGFPVVLRQNWQNLYLRHCVLLNGCHRSSTFLTFLAFSGNFMTFLLISWIFHDFQWSVVDMADSFVVWVCKTVS